MELRQLRSFAAAARCGGFTRAAEALGVAQPVLSQQIRRLEESLQTELLRRTPSGAQPTLAGELALRRVTRIEAELDAMLDELAQLRGSGRGHVRLGVTLMPRAFGLSKLLAGFRREHPTIDVLLRSGTADAMERMLEAGDIDLAFVTVAPGGPANPRVASTGALQREDIVALVPPTHPFAAAGTVSLATLAEHDLVAPEPGAAVREIVEHALRSAGLTASIPFATNDPEMVRLLAASGIGIGVGAAALLQPGEQDLVGVPIVSPRLTRDIALTWHADRSQSPAVASLREFVTLPRPRG